MRLKTLSVLLLLFSLGLTTAPAIAAGAPATWHGEIDGVPVWITVLPREHEISAQSREREPWWNWGNTTTDAYLFAVQSPDNVQLILDFQQQPDGSPEASLYLNNMGTAALDYSLEAGALTILSNNGYPYLTLRPETGGWFVDGKVNYDLSLSVDGVLRGFGSDQSKTDGQIDVSIRVGSTQPGIPDWQTLRLVGDKHPDWGYPRFVVRQRMPHAPPFRAASPLIPGFPYFGMGATGINWFNENPTPLYFNLTNSEFALFPFPGFHIGGMYEINSLAEPPYVDFESPFALYSFDATTREPQLVVRAHSFPAYDPFGPEPKALPRSTFRYSWKVFDNTRWAYSLSFAGPYTYSQEINVGGETFWGVPGADLPTWVTSKEWPVTTFVEAVNGYPGSEGIYFYSAQSNTSWDWLGGIGEEAPPFLTEPYLPSTDDLTDAATESLPVGFRGEYNDTYLHTPRLYLSPLDGRLHLLYAQGGTWNLGNGQILRMHNLNHDAYIDGWTREQVPAQSEGSETTTESPVPKALPGKVEETLYALDDFIIYSGAGEAQLSQVSYRPSSFETAPPTDRDSWQKFQERLALDMNQKRDPEDLKSWLAAFRGKTLSISGGEISDVRTTSKGFRFVLALQPGYQVQANELLAVSVLKPGRYVVTYDGRFTVQPLTPPEISISLVYSPPTPLELNAIQVLLRNDGLEDLRDAAIELWATSPQGTTRMVATREIQILAGETVATTLLWAPSSSGVWSLRPKLRPPHGRLISGHPVSIAISPSPNKSPLNLLFVSTSSREIPAIVLVMILLSMLTAVVFWYEWAGPLVRKADSPAASRQLSTTKIAGLTCPNCEAQQKQSRAGFNRSGSQRYYCGQCKRRYTLNPTTPRYSPETRMLAINMYLHGRSYDTISRFLNAHPQSVAKWVKQYKARLSPDPVATEQTMAELDQFYSSSGISRKDWNETIPR